MATKKTNTKKASPKKTAAKKVSTTKKSEKKPTAKKPATKKAAVKKTAANKKAVAKPKAKKKAAPKKSKKEVLKRYSNEDLKAFKDLIKAKLVSANAELNYYQKEMTASGEQTSDGKSIGMEDGAGTLEKEQLNQMASRQKKYIQHLENALIRIQNKSYGVCRVTGKLISKARLLAVPHATLSIEAKLAK